MKDQVAPCPICSKPEERKFRPFCSAECSNVDLDRVRGELIAGLEQLAETLLGPPSIRKPRTWRWGTKGAFVLEMSGRKRGAWHDKDSEKGGGPFHLIAHARPCSMGEAIAWARDWTGGTPNAGHDFKTEQAGRQAERDRKAREHAAEDAKDGERRIGIAQRLWAQSVPIAGTVAERYLVETRRIQPEVKSDNITLDLPSFVWPDSVRFHKPSNSLIVAATLADGAVSAVQRVRLTPDGQKAEGTAEAPTKVTNGVLAGAAVRLPPLIKADNISLEKHPLLIAEGPETGLSVWAATGHETWIALGGMAGLALPLDDATLAAFDAAMQRKDGAPAGNTNAKAPNETTVDNVNGCFEQRPDGNSAQAGLRRLRKARRVVACRDDDPKHSPGDRKMVKAVETWRSAGHQVAVATPWPFRAYDKSDFNDALKLDGVRGVRRRIEAALNPGGEPPARLPIRVVRDKLRTAVAGFFDDTRAFHAAAAAPPPVFEPEPNAEPLDWGDVLDAPAPASADPLPMPVHAIRVDVGSGKTLTAYAKSIQLLVEMRAAGDTRAAAFAVPTHALGDEQAAIFQVHARGTGLTAAVWRGMSATDPDSPANPMCRNLEAAQDAKDAMLDVFKTTCKRKLANGEEAICPHFSACGYQRQRESSADLWIVAHEMIFGEKPNTIGKLAFLVVDESVWADGLDGVHGRPTALSLDSIGHLPPPALGANLGRQLDHDRLEYLRNRLLDALRSSGEGPVTADTIEMSDLSIDNTREAYRLEWARFVDPGMHPAMTKAQRREAVMAAAVNATIPRLASVWEAMTALLEDGGPQRSGWAALATQPSEDGPVKVLHLKGRRKVRKGWQVPTLLIDATLNIDLVRPYWPGVRMTAELLADAPHQHIRQVVDRAYSKSAIEPLLANTPGYSPEEAQRRHRGLRNVHAILNREARQYHGAPVLVVTQKAVREALPLHGPMAICIDLGHHNAVAGRDQWRDVRALIVVGRTQPAPASVERLAEALTGRAVEHVDGWYARGDGVRHTAADGAVAIEADRHPDPIAEAIRWQICEGELVQITGRGRGVNRTEDDPLDVLVLTDAPLPLPVEATLQAADLAPNPDDLMVAAGGVLFDSPADASAVYPHLWATKAAAKMAMWKTKVVSSPYKESILGEGNHLRRAEYQRAGQGQQASTAWFDPGLAPDLAEWLTARLGALAWCHTGADSDPPPSPSATQDVPRPQPPDPPAKPMPVWDDMERLMAAPDHLDPQSDILEQERAPMPEMPIADPSPGMVFTDRDQPGLDPAAVYGRGALEAPWSEEFAIPVPGELPIRVRGRPGVITGAPRLTLLQAWAPPAARPGVDCSAAALLTDAMSDVRRARPEPGD